MNRKERRRLEKAARQTGDTESARPPTGGGGVSSAPTATSGAPRGGAGADIPAILRQAFTFHAAGRPREALGLYRRILADQPDHADALNHAGVAAFQLGDTADAVELLRAAVDSADLGSRLDAALSVDELRVFKPDPRVYQLAVDRLGVEAGRICFVSTNGWDAAGAAYFGFKVAWLNRFGQQPERLPGAPAAVIETLAELPDLLRR